MTLLADCATQLEPVVTWKVDVEQDQIRLFAGNNILGVLGVGDVGGRESTEREVFGCGLAKFKLVINHQNLATHVRLLSIDELLEIRAFPNLISLAMSVAVR